MIVRMELQQIQSKSIPGKGISQGRGPETGRACCALKRQKDKGYGQQAVNREEVKKEGHQEAGARLIGMLMRLDCVLSEMGRPWRV